MAVAFLKHGRFGRTLATAAPATARRLGKPAAPATARRFGYDATKPKNKRKRITANERSEDAELTRIERSKLITSARDLPRNFTIAAWMVRKHLDYVATFNFHCRHQREDINQRVEAFVANWSKRQNCDVSGRFSLRKQIRLAEARRTLDGDILNVRIEDGRLQWIEGDRLRFPDSNTSSTKLDAADFIHGVKVADGGAHESFLVCKRGKLSDAGASATRFEFERIVSADNAKLHGYFDRFDQVRGISPMAAAINTLQDTYEGFDYALAKIKLAQLFGLVTNRKSEQSLGEVEEDDETGEKIVEFGSGPVVLDFEVGEDAKFLESHTPSNETQAFLTTSIAVALKSIDIPFSFYAENFSNYSGSRQALLQYEQSAESKRCDNRELLDEITRWRLALAIIDGELDLDGIPLEEISWEWVSVGLPWIDPDKEITADIKAVGSCMSSRTRRLKSRGEDFREIVDELAAENDYLVEKGLSTLLPGMPSPPANAKVDPTKDPKAAAGMPASPTDKAAAPIKRSALLEMAGGIDGMLSILDALAAGKITRDTAVALVALFYQISTEEASKIVGESGEQPPDDPANAPPPAPAAPEPQE